MDIKQLEYFIECAKYSSLTKAAEVLYTTQPHVSMVIKSLEDELGCKLFARRSRGIELTHEGQKIYAYADKIMNDTATIRSIGKESNKRWLRIASNPSSYMASVINDRYDYFQKNGILVKYTECGAEQMINTMFKERYDIGFIFSPINKLFAMSTIARHNSLEYVELFKSGLIVSVGQSHPLYEKSSVSPAELNHYSFIQMDEDYFTIEELLGADSKENSKSQKLNRVITTNSDHLMMQTLNSGKACNISSIWIRDTKKRSDVKMIPIEGYESAISFGYLKHKHHSLRTNAQEFLDYLCEHYSHSTE